MTTLPITFSTHNRTEYATTCLKKLIENLKFDGDIYLYICDDRSTKEHINSLIETLRTCNFSNYEIISCTEEHYGYGYVLNTALDKAYSYSDVALTMEDDWLLQTKTDFNIPVNMLLNNSDKYAGIRLCVKEIDGLIHNNLPNNFFMFKNVPRLYFAHYVFQCMLRHKKIFEKIRFLENTFPQRAELDLKDKYKKIVLKPKLNHLLMLNYILPDGSPIFKHIGKISTMPGNRNNYR